MIINKPKVLVLTSSYPKFKGDINGNFVHELATRLKRDFDIFVLAPAFRGSLNCERIDDIQVYRHKQFLVKNIELAYGVGLYENLKRNKLKYLMLLFYFLFQMLLLSKLTRRAKINVVHAHWLIPNALIAVLYKKIFRSDFKIIATIHGSDFWGFWNKMGNAMKKYTLNNIDALTVVSNAIKEKVIEFGYRSEVFVYPMGLDTNLFSPAKKDITLKERLQIKGPFLLFVGIIVEQKGIRYLIQAMPNVIEAFPDAKLVVVGEGNLKTEMVDLTTRLDLAENVTFTGSMPHDELPHFFATADIFILPSFSEGWPVVVMEAISCGTPAIVTNISVFEKHEHKAQLFTVVPVGDSASIAEGINRLLSKNEISSSKSTLRNYAMENFNWVVISNKYKELMLGLIE